MIVTCDQCTSKYRVNEEKLPPEGGNIQCPGCSHIFFVEPPRKVPMFDDGNTSVNIKPPAAAVPGDDEKTNVAPAPTHPGDDEKTNVAPAPTRSADQEEKRPELAGDSWKLKTNFGLVYDFPDTPSVQSWLLGREDLSGYKLSRDGVDFKDIDAFKEVITPALRAKLSAAAAGLTRSKASSSQPAASQAAGSGLESSPESALARPKAAVSSTLMKARSSKPAAVIRPIRPRHVETNNRAWLYVSVLVLILAVAFGLHYSGAVDFTRIFKGTNDMPPPVVAAPPAPETGAAPTQGQDDIVLTGQDRVEPPPRQPTPTLRPFGNKEHIRLLLEQAETELRDNDYEKAIATLGSARGLSPNEPEIYRLLERAHSRNGDSDAAREARQRYRDLTEEGTP